eukprot:scaffold20942_cov113-Isochrysis_galbana.AAC.3
MHWAGGLIHSPLEGKPRTLNTLAQAVVVHAALTLTPSHRKKRPEKGKKGWQRMGEGRGSDRAAMGQCVFRRRAASG